MIRSLQESDVAPLRDIYNHYVRTSTSTFESVELTEEQMHSRLFAPSEVYPCLVAEIDGKVVGYCAAHPWRPRFDHVAELTMYLSSEVRSKGLGTEMLAKIIPLCKEIKHLNGLITCINADNLQSRTLVEKFGFKLAGYYPKVGRKFDQWLDDVDYLLQF